MPCPVCSFPELDSEKGIAQVPIWPKGYKVLVANVLGRKDVKGAIVVPAEPFMVLPIRPEWQSFEDYLGAMSTKYRTRAKKALKLAEGCEHVDLSHAPVHTLGGLGVLLAEANAARQNRDPSRLLGSAFESYKENLGEAFRVFGYRKDGHWVGFITAIVDDEAVHAMHMGFEPHYAQQSQFYQRSMMDLVRLAMEERKPLLNMGRTATEMKSTMGAMPVENSFVFFSPRPVFALCSACTPAAFTSLPNYTLRSPSRPKARHRLPYLRGR